MMVAMKPVFLLYYYHLSAQVTAFQLFLVFIHGFSLDATVAGWFYCCPFIVGDSFIVGTLVTQGVASDIAYLFWNCHIAGECHFAVDLGLYEYWDSALTVCCSTTLQSHQ